MRRRFGARSWRGSSLRTGGAIDARVDDRRALRGERARLEVVEDPLGEGDRALERALLAAGLDDRLRLDHRSEAIGEVQVAVEAGDPRALRLRDLLLEVGEEGDAD